jgi:hypothetical protein
MEAGKSSGHKRWLDTLKGILLWCQSGLPEGMFSTHFVYISEGLGMEKACIFFVHLEYLTDIWYIICPFGTFWYVVARKIWQPWCQCLYFSLCLNHAKQIKSR